MREIRPSGSGEGAVLSRPYLISRQETSSAMEGTSAFEPRFQRSSRFLLPGPWGVPQAKTECRRWR